MKALVVNAEWSPRDGYPVTIEERTQKRAASGSRVWRNPEFEFKNISEPDLNDDELLIRVKRCGICGSDTHLYETDREGYIIFSGPVRLPSIIGHEYSGIVERTGRGVRGFKAGDSVTVESVSWCGRCTPCRSGSFNQCEHVELVGITVDGAMADFVKANDRSCWNINSLFEVYDKEEVYDVGALIEPVGCAYNGIFISGGGFKPGANATVFGVGPIGLGAVALLRIAGASIIIAFDIKDERLEIAAKLGADFTFNVNALRDKGVTPGEIIMDITKGAGAEIQIEAAGAASQTIPEMERTMAVNGKIVYLGRAAQSTPIYLDILVSGAKSIVGARGHAGYGIYNNIIRLLLTGRLKVLDMVTSHFDFNRAMEGIKKSTERIDGKIMLKMDD